MKRCSVFFICVLWLYISLGWCVAAHAEDNDEVLTGGGYAATGQAINVSYATVLYGATNGLPTSDATCVLCSSEGRIWIGGYAGVIVYDGKTFERLDSTDGLTSARALFEDKKGRIWVGTNDNGIVVLDGDTTSRYTYEQGLPSSSVRCFAEDNDGNVFAGTTAGLVYIGPSGKLNRLSHKKLDTERIKMLDSDGKGMIYGQTASGSVFTIEECAVKSIHNSSDLGFPGRISAVMTDSMNDGNVYIGTENGGLYYGSFGERAAQMKKIPVDGISSVQCICYACNRVFVTSTSKAGYLDEALRFHIFNDMGIDSGIEMMIPDYQGNLWFASSTQGVLKLVKNNFQDLSMLTELEPETTNAVCKMSGKLYVGTESGLRIIDRHGRRVTNELTECIGNNRVRCIMSDTAGNLWVSVYTGDVGLVCLSRGGYIDKYTRENGMPSNEVRCTSEQKDGSILVGTNSGLVIIKDRKIIRSVGAGQGMKNTVILTVAEGNDGKIYAGSDGDGLYVVDGTKVERIGREEGLTSDVVLRVRKDEEKDVCWIVTSNSVGYLKDGKVRTIKSFPYNNNYDIYSDKKGKIWVLSSNGIYCVPQEDMLFDQVKNPRFFSLADGLPFAVTSVSYNYMNQDGEMYVAGRKGVIKFNTGAYFDNDSEIKIDLSSLYSSEAGEIKEKDGVYRIPSAAGRISIKASVMDYSMSDPIVRIYLEGLKDVGETEVKSRLMPLEYTELPYGKYVLHIQILNEPGEEVIHEKTYNIEKLPGIHELLIVRFSVLFLFLSLVGMLFWYLIKNALVRRQYDRVRIAKEKVERTAYRNMKLFEEVLHVLKTQVNTILGIDEMILREDESLVPKEYVSTISEYANDIRFASASIMGVFDELYEMIRIDNGYTEIKETDYELQDLLISVLTIGRSICEVRELSWDITVDEVMPKRLHGDMQKIKAVVVNMIFLAVKCIDDGGIKLDIAMRKRINDICELVFSVRLKGNEINAEYFEDILNDEKRSSSDTAADRSKKCLERNIIEGYIELTGGRIKYNYIEKDEMELVFSIRQRIVEDSALGNIVKKFPKDRIGQYVPQFIAPDVELLLVDGDHMELKVVKGLLKSTRIFVSSVKSGEECLYLLKETRFDMVILDQMLSGMDAFETVQRIKTVYPDMPVHILTADSSLGEDYFRSKGFDEVIHKPIDGITLERAVMNHLPEEKMKVSAL